MFTHDPNADFDLIQLADNGVEMKRHKQEYEILVASNEKVVSDMLRFAADPWW